MKTTVLALAGAVALAAAPAACAQAHPGPGHAAPISLADGASARWVVLNHGREAGEMRVERAGASVMVRYAHIDRNRGRWMFGRYELDASGRVVGAGAGSTDRAGQPGEVAESFRIPEGEGSDGGFFLRRYATPFEEARLARWLLSRPAGRARLSPTGQGHAEVVAERSVQTDRGLERVRLVMVDRGGPAESGVWLDEQGELFATEVGWFITVRDGAERALATLREAEVEYRNRQAEALAARLTQPAEGPLVISDGDVFDSRTGTMRPGTTVIIRDGRIDEVGPADRVRIPAGAVVIEATGKTVMPGMWDMHSHSGLTSQNTGAPLQLAHGLTTVRDLAADLDVATSLRDRADAGTILSPRQILAGFMEGPGLWAGPTEVLVRTEDEARDWVARYHSLGYRQIKLYNLVHPDLLPTIAAESRRRGMRLSGHVPRGLTLEAAVELGYDEVNHAAFLFSNFFQDSLYLPEMRPYSGVASAVAATFDVESPGMTRLIEFLADRGTVVDGTFNIWMGGTGALEGEATPAAQAYGRLLKRLYDAGVPIVPGTDNFSGSTYLTELRLYEHYGIPAADVLRMATLIPARVMGDEAEYGSIDPGKVADLLIVDGRPAERIQDLERIDRVIRAGRVYDPAEIRRAVGLQDRDG